jgi:Heparinase II/III-like protein/Heparinase II/III N-terminus
MPSRLTITLKALSQLGLEPLALNALYRFGLWTGHYKRVEESTLRNLRPAATIQNLFSLPAREKLLQTVDTEGRVSLLREADEIVAGEVRLFGGEPVPLQLSFSERLQHWTTYESHPQLLAGLYSPLPDVKFLWEPARFGWAFILGRAYNLSGHEKYAEAFWRYFECFEEGNPAYLGPHWMNGQEVAIRLISFVWAAQAFEGSNASTPIRGSRLAQSVALHAARIPPTLVYARSQENNHLILEAAALYTAGTSLNQPRWRELGWSWLNRGLQHQISSYGEYVQHSSNYHRLMLQTALWVDAILRRQNRRWPYATQEALIRASHWLFSMIDPITGQAPNLGANDGALILPLSVAAFSDFRPTVQAAARAFLRTGLPPGSWDEMSLWLGLSPAQRTADSDAYMTEHLRARNSWGYLRASRFRSRLSHMDQLHFDLWWRGLNIAQDAGTYLYNAALPWNNSLVSTRVHNTVTVDGRDQMVRGGRFLTLDWFPAFSKSVIETDENILGRVIAYHKGYRRLGIRHERVATVYTDERWVFTDNMIFTAPGEHVFRLHWLLLDGEWEPEERSFGFGIRMNTSHGRVTVLVTPDLRLANSDFRLTLVRAGELVSGKGQPLPFEGWVSRTYGQKTPALSLALEVTSSRSFSFVSEFLFP